MPFQIQRLPTGLGQVLSTFGGHTPRHLEEGVHGSIELLQNYGLTQLQSGFASNAAAAEGTAVNVVLSATSWTVLFGASVLVTKTGTMTALATILGLNRGTQFGQQLAAQEFTAFGATVTGNVVTPWRAPYPLLCPPGTIVNGQASIIGTDATANVNVFAEFGVLG